MSDEQPQESNNDSKQYRAALSEAISEALAREAIAREARVRASLEAARATEVDQLRLHQLNSFYHRIAADASLRYEAVLPERSRLIAEVQAKETELSKLKEDWLKAVQEKDAAGAELSGLRAELETKQRFNNILNSIEPHAQALLLKDEDFAKDFAKDDCKAFVMSVDIRKSTDLMLKAVRPREFANFIKQLCEGLRAIVLSKHGIFDKFTGDGILAFFPDFYSGEDAGYLAVKAADECHALFKVIYTDYRRVFTSATAEAGLGIGIDYGPVDMVPDLGNLTVVGPPVVYACRFGGAPAHTTLLNIQAYEVIFERYSAYCNIEETTLAIKNEGPLHAYQVSLNKKPHVPKSPSWFAKAVAAEKAAESADPKPNTE